jgi:predicted small lipoprotein YifL
MKPESSPRTRILWVALTATVCASLALGGCGQKGNLYLPNQKTKVPGNAPQSQPQPAPPAPPSDPPASPNSGA